MSSRRDQPEAKRWTKVLRGGQWSAAISDRAFRPRRRVIFRIHHGKVAHSWKVFDECGMRRQLGVLTPPP